MNANLRQLLEEGSNCQIITRGDATLLIDAARYFQQLDLRLNAASKSIIIVGWDFDGAICLDPEQKPDISLGCLLRRLVEDKPELEVRILVWNFSIVHAPGDPTAKLFGAAWQEHPRIHFVLDRKHPFNACHHQKIVVIDDQIGFVGGIDLTVERRDTTKHRAHSRMRSQPNGETYGPVHDMQVMVTGGTAASLVTVALQRWKAATGEMIPKVVPAGKTVPFQAEFLDASMAISCSSPAWRGQKGLAHGAQLAADMISAAEKLIYIEAQYFTANYLFEALEPQLARQNGPEIVLVLNSALHSLMEKWVLGENRDRLLRRLVKADRYNRLAAYYPVVPSENGPCPVLVHSKLILVDDACLRVGSSNLNNRSIALDAECDLTVHASLPPERAAVTSILNRLLAEHLGTSPEEVAGSIARLGSVIGAIDALRCADRTLTRYEIALAGPTRPVFGTWLVDPAHPLFAPMPRLSNCSHRESDRRNRDSATNNAAIPTASGIR